MSKKKVTRKTTIKPTKSTIVKSKSGASSEINPVSTSTNSNSSSADLLFGKTNYMYILGGIGLMVIGFVLMSGGSMPDPNTWDESIIYSTRRTLIAPIFILAGLVVQVLAIFKKSN
ncbi:MAG: DUF3098 domain-containing protein [Saprospiraceae bacterium]|nr:DUF3098 domain-containing protein [Saprospiraceae bacterium]